MIYTGWSLISHFSPLRCRAADSSTLVYQCVPINLSGMPTNLHLLECLVSCVPFSECYVCMCVHMHACVHMYLCICVCTQMLHIMCACVLKIVFFNSFAVAAAVRDLRNDAVPFMAGVVRHITMVAVVQQCSKYIQ